jgi:hypothetical protein
MISEKKSTKNKPYNNIETLLRIDSTRKLLHINKKCKNLLKNSEKKKEISIDSIKIKEISKTVCTSNEIMINKESIENDTINLNEKNSFIDFLFESKSKKSTSNDSLQSIQSTNTIAPDTKSIISYLGNLKLKNRLNLKAVNNYIDLYNTLSNLNVKYYFDKRSNEIDCICIQNGLGCCLKKFHQIIINMKDDLFKQQENNFDKCCCECNQFDFYHFRIISETQNIYNLSELELNKFETEEPDWMVYLNDFKIKNKFNFIKDSIYVNNLLRMPSVHEFLIRKNEVKCNCLKRGLDCCLKKMFELSESSDRRTNYLNDFLEYSCCLNCQYEKNINTNENFFKSKLINSNSSSLEELNNKVIDISLNTKITEKDEIIRDSQDLTKECNDSVSLNKSIDKINPVNESIKETTEEFKEESFAILDPNDKNSFINLFFNSKNLDKSLNNLLVCSSNSKIQNEEKDTRSIENSLVKSTTMPNISMKSSLKTNVSRKSESNTRKSKTVTFIDEKYGLTCIPIPEWSENLREPVYSKKRTNINEWKTDSIKNNYELTKLKLSNSLYF